MAGHIQFTLFIRLYLFHLKTRNRPRISILLLWLKTARPSAKTSSNELPTCKACKWLKYLLAKINSFRQTKMLVNKMFLPSLLFLWTHDDKDDFQLGLCSSCCKEINSLPVLHCRHIHVYCTLQYGSDCYFLCLMTANFHTVS